MSTPTLPKIALGPAYELTVDSITGHGRSFARLSVNRVPPVANRAARTLVDGAEVSRQELIEFGLQLLDLADQMVDDRAFAGSLAAGSINSQIPFLRAKDATQRYYKLVDRLPLLQLAQRALERCDDTTASTLTVMLGIAESTGKLPVRAQIGFKSEGTPADKDASEHLAEPDPQTKH